MKNVVVAGFARSPFHPARRGALAGMRPDDLLAQIFRGLVERTGIDAADIEDALVGCAMPEGEQGLNLGRLAALLAGLPLSVAGATINRFCGSSMSAIHMAAGAILAGAGDLFLCGGVESMSRVPIGGFNPLPNPALARLYPGVYADMGTTAETLARKYEISRAEQEAFALRSQARARAAIQAGHLAEEIIPVTTPKGVVVADDGCPRPDSTAEGLAALKPAFDAQGSVTAGTSSPLTDGAAAVLVCTRDYADAHGLRVLARVVALAVSGCAPEIMGIGPVQATRKALRRAGIGVEALDVVELNEAFASQSLACIRDLGLRDETVNIDGGAIALGHPLGATGARIVGKAASLLARTGGRYGLATQCIGGGQGIATVLERA